MAEARRREMTVDEFYRWCLDQEERYELVDGFPVPLRAMTGANNVHDQILVNVIIALGNQLKWSGCRPVTSNTAVRTAIKRTRRPDVTVDCGPPDPKSYEARNPVAVFEVLSPTTRKHDRSIKLQEFLRHPSLRTIVHIDPDIMDVLVYKRGGDGQWDTERLEQPDHKVVVEGTPAALALGDIYDGVPLQVPDTPPGI